MLKQTILNPIQKFKGFVYGKENMRQWNGTPSIEIEIHPRKGSRGVCSGCGKSRPGYDVRDRRRFEFIPFWKFQVFFIYQMRRVYCPSCGVKIEMENCGGNR